MICTSASVAAAEAAARPACMLCTAISHQLDPVTPVCAVVCIGEGVQQQLVNAVRVPAASIHQRDEDVGHASRAGQDEPRCRIGDAFVHPLRRESSRVQSRVLAPVQKLLIGGKPQYSANAVFMHWEPTPLTDAHIPKKIRIFVSTFPLNLPQKIDLQPNS